MSGEGSPASAEGSPADGGRPPASVVVRTKNSARTLDACLRSLRAQTVQPEIVVVDSGSTDRTLALADRYADRILELPSDSFSYGRALNRGAEVATAALHFAVSSHCVLERRDWIERSLRHYGRPDVAATNGQITRPDGMPLREPLLLGAGTRVENPLWGFSNHASSWRASVWREQPFDEQLLAAEDLEWSDRVLALGFKIVFDPELLVVGRHLRDQGPLALYRRSRRELLGVARFRDVQAPSVRRTLTEWWCNHPAGTKRHRQLLSPYRIAMLAGRYAAGRQLSRALRHAPAADVLYVASGTTPGHRRADRQWLDGLRSLGLNVASVTGDYTLPSRLRALIWKSLLSIDLFEALVLRHAAARAVRLHRPRAIVYASSHAAMLQPRRRIEGPVGIRFDAPAQLSRRGSRFAVERWLERRQFARARLLIPAAVSLEEALARLLPAETAVVPVPIPLDPVRGPSSDRREPIVVAYAGQAHKKGLDQLVSAWARSGGHGRRLVITGIERAHGLAYLADRGIREPRGSEWLGPIAAAEHRALTRRAEIYLAAPRYEDYGIAQLEALADGAMLVTTPAPGPYVALGLARRLDSRLVAADRSTPALAVSLEAALTMPAHEQADYRRRAQELLDPFTPEKLKERLRDEIVPALLS